MVLCCVLGHVIARPSCASRGCSDGRHRHRKSSGSQVVNCAVNVDIDISKTETRGTKKGFIIYCAYFGLPRRRLFKSVQFLWRDPC